VDVQYIDSGILYIPLYDALGAKCEYAGYSGPTLYDASGLDAGYLA
jgi:hypothetical protein